MKKVFLCLSFASLIGTAFAQNDSSSYDNRAAFAPDFYTDNGNSYRSAVGAPGPDYWQNRADYNIDVKLDTTAKRIDGSVQINYTNNSPDNLPYVWLYVEQNIYREDSRSVAATDVVGNMRRYAAPVYTQGDELKSVSVTLNGKTFHPKYVVSDTRLQILLPEALKAKGGKLQINIDYGFKIPEKGTDRMGRLLTKNGWIYELAQWYPRMCVYDDVEGWNTLPYLGAGEFYLEYGNFNYSITAPSNLIIAGSGTLQNPTEVLTASQQQKLAQAKNSDATVTVHSLQDVLSGKDRLNKKELTWKFQCLNTRDVAWAASKAFIWDAARIKMHSGKIILGQSVYPEDSKPIWDSSTYFTKRSIELNSYWHDFPYPVATNVAGIVGGMEYPGIVFCDWKESSAAEFWFVTEHEFGHNWFPMLVGSNERKYAWMDEGFNTFTNFVNSRIFNNGAYNNEPDKYKVAKRFFSKREEPLMTIPDVIQPYTLADVGYYRPAVGLLILRDVILGHDRFDYAFKKYINDWAYKHPTPYDFFHAMDNGAGEDLTWFWRGWFYNTWNVDQAVKGVKYESDSSSLVTIENIGKMPLPVKIKIEEENGKVTNLQLPVEIWQRGAVWTFRVNTTSKIKEVTLDPEHEYPDTNPENNLWKE
ncbi:peptidase M1 [Arachidicoccus ginsenosidimutans]|uniref:M1 family metallopeptidase n=1 Tax=Arachidicoccus sp. BS20 TaxID=1850526 RepID=UPI0007F0CEDA|nr:M1 family metallopeptidase [Arachidicoccus sp. BS20]ANI89857.1 peptidase M1 [Arachidicoccus sp. BS20]